MGLLRNYTVLIILMVLIAPLICADEKTINVGSYDIHYTYSNALAAQGERFSLDITITNTGSNDKSGVKFSLDGDSDLDVTTDDWIIGDLPVDKSVTKSFRIDVDDDAESGRHYIDFTLRDSSKVEEDSLDVDIESDSPEIIIGNLESSPTQISPDIKDIDLKVTLENIGGGDATFVRARLILPDGFESSSSFSDSTNLGTISKDGQKIATFKINSLPELKSGLSNSKILIDYKDGSDSQTVTLPFEIPVLGRPQFIISSYKPKTFYVGDKSSVLSIKTLNSGEEEGKETSIRVFENSDLPISFSEKTKTVGSLLPGEEGSANFIMDINNKAVPGNYIIKVQVRTVQNGNVLISDDKIEVNIAKKEKSSIVAYLIIPMVILIIAAIILLIYSYRKKAGNE